MNSYSPGEIISANCPLVHVLNDNKKSFFCDNCLLTRENLKKCSNCKYMYYCDSLCQKIDWKKHKYECPIYKEFYNQLEHNLERFLLRLYLFLKNNPSKLTKLEQLQYDKSKERSFQDLLTHQSEIEQDSIRSKRFCALTQRYNECKIEFVMSTLFEYFCKICINSFSILDVNLNEIGTALYVAESSFDHSCSPNAAPVFNGTYLEIRAIKQINKGDKVNINYVDLKENKTKRHNQLRQQYYFECECDRCNSNFDDEFDSEKLQKLNKEMDQYIDNEGKWDKAFVLCQQSIDLYRQVYGDYHPDLTVQLVRLAKLRLCHDLDNDGIALVSQAGRHIQITHGSNHELFRVYRDLIH